jgi:hypothetical protein
MLSKLSKGVEGSPEKFVQTSRLKSLGPLACEPVAALLLAL